MNKDSDQLHGLEEWSVPEGQVDEKVACEEAAKDNLFCSAT